MANNLEKYTSATQTLCASFTLENAYISPLITADIAALKAIGMHPDIWRFARFPKETTDAFDCYLKRVLSEPNSLLFTIRCGSTHKAIGFTRLKNINLAEKRAEIGTWLTGEYQGKKLNRYIKQQVLKVGFNILQLDEIYCYVTENNQPSIKSLLAFGFQIDANKQRLSPTQKGLLEIPQHYIFITAAQFNSLNKP
ncbi:GNAT family N-acetyltransferase [Shewanella pealeana]|uniref:GCN5-related N-acetyltransferase n=1 Tax=Shewanella pealeana (strain ATCC 700345 / ANG-SQ1) TaxID=398579 RepID=A8H7P8_SHEPA|nr:GNAT family N-acetyltransferase [Shewanella pealeana]ABV88585.1 GCN5-related N-acetyltransferase [Shewanella pealeana ATCC 700345]